METKNEVVSQAVIRLNEIKSVKLANVSKSKREGAKFSKQVANYLLQNWDNLSELKRCYDSMRRDCPHVSCSEVMDIYKNRMEELEQPKKKAGAPKKWNIGDHHPTKPWVWTLLKSGVEDWRTDPSLKKKPGRKSVAVEVVTK